jgi:uncharacterized membrane protein
MTHAAGVVFYLAVFLSGTIGGLLFVSAYMARAEARWCFLAAGLLLLVGIAVTIAIEVPINKAIASWTPDRMAADWAERRARWVRFHWVRTVMGMAAFACAVAAVLIR